MGVKPVPLLLWQIADGKGNIRTELGIEVDPGVILKLPADVMKQSLPVNDKLQKLLMDKLHPELVKANADGPKAAPLGRTPKKVAAGRMPKDIDVAGAI